MQTLTPALPKPPKAVLSAAVPSMPLPPAPGAFCPCAWPLALQDQDGAQGCELAPSGAVQGVQGKHTGLAPAPGVPTARAGARAVGEQGSIPVALCGDRAAPPHKEGPTQPSSTGTARMRGLGCLCPAVLPIRG